MWKKRLSLIFVILIFLFIIIFMIPRDKVYYVEEVKSPVEIKLSDNKVFKLNGLESFDDKYTEHNRALSQKLGISEEEAFVLGNLAKYWASGLIKNR